MLNMIKRITNMRCELVKYYSTDSEHLQQWEVWHIWRLSQHKILMLLERENERTNDITVMS